MDDHFSSHRPADNRAVWQRAASWLRRNRTAAGVVAALAVATVLALLVGRVTDPAEKQSTDEQFHAATEAFHRHEYVTALAALDAALKMDPNHPAALRLKTQILIAEGNYVGATRFLQPLVDTTADDQLKRMYALACVQLKDRRQEAIRVYRGLYYQSNDRTTATVNNLARALIEDGQFDEAETILRDSSDPHPTIVYHRTVLALRRAQVDPTFDPSDVVAAVEKTLNLKKPNGELSLMLARLRVFATKFKPQKIEDIVDDLRRALENGVPREIIFNDPVFRAHLIDPQVLALADIPPSDAEQLSKYVLPY
jgi:tetratricopeptide (TPR) repeat protein